MQTPGFGLGWGTGWGLAEGALAPAWVVVPVAALALLVVAAHVLLIDRAAMPAARKRIRSVNGLLMMFAIPLTTAAFCVVSPEQSRLFVMLWMLVVGLIVMILLVAIVDVANTYRMHRAERRELRRQLAETRAMLQAAAYHKGGGVSEGTGKTPG